MGSAASSARVPSATAWAIGECHGRADVTDWSGLSAAAAAAASSVASAAWVSAISRPTVTSFLASDRDDLDSD